jgi:aryl-alcohol dehydrogenase-like predicted oxidoreductase
LGQIGDRIRDSINDSLLRLRREQVDVVMLHNPVRALRDPTIRQWMRLTPADVIDQVMPALSAARAAGKTRFLGLACESSETSAVRSLLETREFAMINAWFNLTNPTAAVPMGGFPNQQDYEGLFEAAVANGARVAVIRPLAGGALTDAFLDRGAEARHDLSRGYYRDNPQLLEPEMERARRFAFLRDEGRQSLSLAAYRYILGHPAVSSIVGGFSDLAQLDEAARASDLGPLPPAVLAEVAKVHAAGFFTRQPA